MAAVFKLTTYRRPIMELHRRVGRRAAAMGDPPCLSADPAVRDRLMHRVTRQAGQSWEATNDARRTIAAISIIRGLP